MNQVEDIIKDSDPKWFEKIEGPLKRVESIVKKTIMFQHRDNNGAPIRRERVNDKLKAVNIDL